jgi:hypothetical protein
MGRAALKEQIIETLRAARKFNEVLEFGKKLTKRRENESV